MDFFPGEARPRALLFVYFVMPAANAALMAADWLINFFVGG